MPEQNYDELVSGAVDTVLETMFFSMSLGRAEPETGASVVKARVAFHGRLCGALGVSLSGATARILAAGFLGEDEQSLTDAQSGEVVCELANMLCGSLVSRIESEESFDLTSPELVRTGDDFLESCPVARQSFEVENGILTVTLHVENAA